MALTRNDFTPEPPPWLIEDWFPIGHKGMDTAPEGSFKTIWGCWLSVCIASGTPVFGMPVTQGPVVIIDEETPRRSLEYHLRRFCSGLGVKYDRLPIHFFSMEGFQFGRKSKIDELQLILKAIEPVYVRMDSMIAMLPSGRQSVSENSDKIGEMIREDLNKIISETRSVLLAVHAKKYISDLSLEEIQNLSMQSITRGHGSIVGEGCDTGFVIKKISEHPEPTRFCILTRPRRQAIPGSHIKFIQMFEERYGEGWARLEEISQDSLPPSIVARDLYPIFETPDEKGKFNHNTSWLSKTYALHAKKEIRYAVSELLYRKVIIQTKPQNYMLNPHRWTECTPEFLKALKSNINIPGFNP